MIRNVLMKRGSLRTALVVGAGLPLLFVASAFAQVGVEAAPTASPTGQAANAPATTGSGAPNTSQTAPNQTQTGATGRSSAAVGPGEAGTNAGSAETERVIVTGSNIPTAEEVGPNPVLNINRDLINKSGERTTEELIRDLPVANANGVPVSNNATGFTPGASSISLRGFGPSATLLLIDGRRVAPYPIGQGGTSSFFDLNSIPRAAIDSIEILKDGASTTYGADAVAGVVNIKLRHNYRGAEATVEYGNTVDGTDSGESSANILFGIGDENTQVTGVIDYYRRNSIFNKDRGFSVKGAFVSSNATPENLQISREAAIAAVNADVTATPEERAAALAQIGGIVSPTTGLPTAAVFASVPHGTSAQVGAANFIFTRGRLNRFNFDLVSGSFPEREDYGGFFNAEHKICGDQLVVYADMFYQKTKNNQELAPSATGNFRNTGGTPIIIPPNAPGPLVGQDAPPEGAAPGAFNPFNPFQQFISGTSRARLLEFGNRLFNFETDAFLTTIGFKGDKLFDGTWGYDAGFRYSEVKNTTRQTLVSNTLFNRVLNANDPFFDPNSAQFLGTTTPFNPFTDALRGNFPSNDLPIGAATVHPTDVDVSKLATFDLNIYTTSLFKLPAGGVGFATGAQFRRENLDQQPDQLEITGDIVGSSRTAITHGGRKDYAIYGEISVPITSPEMNIPGLHSLEFNASGRYEEFRNNNTNVLVPKVGARWQPLDESLTLRATWGEGFREPSLIELFSSPTAALTPVNDPVTGTSDPETTFEFAGNRNLQPEDSRAFSGGIVYTPKFVPNLTLSVDVWGIDRTGVVIQPTGQQVVNAVNDVGGGPSSIGTVERDPLTGGILRVRTQFINAGSEKAQGIDMGIQYAWDIPGGFGRLTSLTQATYLDSFQQAILAGQTETELVNRDSTGTSDDAYLKWKGVSRLDWAWNHLDVSTTARYTGGFREDGFFGLHGNRPTKGQHYVKATWFFDTQATYDFSFAPPVENQPVAGYSKGGKEMVRGKDGKTVEPTQTANYTMPCWKNLINNTSFTIGCNNVFGQDPPVAFGKFNGNATLYPGFIYDPTGRFVYGSITKKF